MNTFVTRMATRFARNEKGSIALQFAFILIPMVAFSGVALDYSTALGIKKQLQDIADSTVIAGARLPATTSDKRLQDAHNMLNAALANAKLDGVKTDIHANNAKVAIDVSYEYKTHLMGILGVDKMEINVTSAAQSQVENGGVACLIALNETTDDGLHLQGINKVSSRNCWSWVNSDSPTAINAVGASMGTGQGFCSHGGAYGADHFEPQPYTECEVMSDPFEEFFRSHRPASLECTHTDLQLKNGTFVLQPGVYCGDTVLKPHAEVTMQPGLYVFKGGYLEIQGQAALAGKSVTLYFNGEDTRMIIRGGGHVDLKAPAEGEYAGFVIAEPRAYFGGIRESVIQGGGRIRIEGVLYAPDWRMNIGGNGEMNQESKYFAMIADHFYMEGNGRLYIQSNAKDAQLPDLMPRIKTGPRLLY